MESEIIKQPTKADINRLMKSMGEHIEKAKVNVIAGSTHALLQTYKIVRFKQRLMILSNEGFPHFTVLHKSVFDDIAYPVLGALSRTKMNDIYSYLGSIAADYSHNEHLISFGYFEDSFVDQAFGEFKPDALPLEDEATPADGSNPRPAPPAAVLDNAPGLPTVWDSRKLDTDLGVPIDHAVWRSPYARTLLPRDEDGKRVRIPFIMSLAGGDEGVYDDIMQSMAPIIMDKKPDGVIWWVGSGANGKSTLMDAIYRLFPGQLASINIQRLVDGRDTPSLNGALANIVKESSDGRVEDSEIYKCLGTHETFRVHKFHSQDDIIVNGNLHTIFSANSIPTFSDKGHSIRRRTFIIPFTQTFESDPDFEKNTFTPEFFGQLASELCRYATQLERQGYKYKWSARTLGAKLEYDKESSNAEEFAREFISDGAVAFTSFQPLKIEYEQWCSEQGYVPLGVTNLRKAMASIGFERMSVRPDDGQSLVKKLYRLRTIGPDAALTLMSAGRPGIYTIDGFQPVPETEDDTVDEQLNKTVLDGKW